MAKSTKELPAHKGERLLTQEDAKKIAALDQHAIEIVTKATQYGINRGIRVSNIINDFFEIEHFQGKTIIEFGPGHYSFALLARYLGATVICVEHNPYLVELGRYLGFEVLDIDFYNVTLDQLGQQVDGLWLKGAFNSCYHNSVDTIYEFVNRITQLIKLNGWGWCVTTNKNDDLEGEEKTQFENTRIEAQREAFTKCGWDVSPIDDGDRQRYSLKHKGSFYYFTRNLSLH